MIVTSLYFDEGLRLGRAPLSPARAARRGLSLPTRYKQMHLYLIIIIIACYNLDVHTINLFVVFAITALSRYISVSVLFEGASRLCA